MLTFNGSTYVSNEVVLTKFISVYRMVWDLITAYTVRNKWEKLEHKGKVIFDISFMIQSHAESMNKMLGAL